MPYDSLISRDDSAALMPEDVSNALLKGLTAESEVLTGFTRVPVGRSQVRFPVLSALPLAYFVNGDTGRKQTSEVNWDNKFLDIEEIAVIVPVPDSVIADSDQPIWDQVMPLLEAEAGRTLDSAVFFGTGAPASWPDDVVTSATAAGNTETVGTAPDTEGGLVGDHSQLLSEIEQDGYDPRRGVAARSFRGLARQARNANGDRFAEIVIREGEVEIDGVVYNTNSLRGQWGDPVAIPYDPSEFVVGVRQDITFKVFTEGVVQDNTGAIVYNLMQQDMSALRLVFRVGWQVANTINHDEPTEADRYPAGVLLGPGS